MIIYFTGTGNSLVVARRLGIKLAEPIISMYDALGMDLTHEKRIGLVYPTYILNAPIAVQEMIPKLQLPTDAYVFIVITCGFMTHNAVWTVRKMLREKGIEVDYCNKIRFPDTAGPAYRRNPNKQIWKLDKYAPRLEEIANEIAGGTHALHYAGFDPVAWLGWWSDVQRENWLNAFQPCVNAQKCVGCGLCSRICPQHNIALRGNRAVIGKKCTNCLRCVHFCPHQALEFAGVMKATAVTKEYQYHHPDICVQDFDREG